MIYSFLRLLSIVLCKIFFRLEVKGKVHFPDKEAFILASNHLYIKGADLALPKGAKIIRPVKISVRVGQEIIFERRQPYQEISALIMDSIRRLAC